MKKLVVFSGAGISKESGIDTFRDYEGLWDKHKIEDVATIAAWRDKSKRENMLNFYNRRRKDLEDKVPNDAHHAIKELEQYFDVCIITQNVDDLHEKAGSKNIIHLHGDLNTMCSSNNKNLTLPYTQDIKVGDRHEDGSQLRPNVVWFGEDVPLIYKASEIVSQADILLIIGTSLQVYPAAGLYEIANTEHIYYIDPNPDADIEGVNVIKATATEGIKTFSKVIMNELEKVSA